MEKWTYAIDEESGEVYNVFPADELYKHEAITWDNVLIAQVNTREQAEQVVNDHNTAPDMLEACKDALSLIVNGPDGIDAEPTDIERLLRKVISDAMKGGE